jgi:hypothetical protein
LDPEPETLPAPAGEAREASGGGIVVGDLLAGRYVVRTELGRGGAGAVYQAFDRAAEQSVAKEAAHTCAAGPRDVAAADHPAEHHGDPASGGADALKSIVPTYERYAFEGTLQPLAHPTAAAAQAARDVLVNGYPAQQTALDAQLATFLARVPDGKGKEIGIHLGKEAAAAIISERTSDGWDATGSYAPRPNSRPGDYRFVPPFDFVFRPAFADAKPFGIEDPTQLRGPPPPELSSAGYTAAYNEVKSLGSTRGSSRSADQSHEARWWYEFAEIGWNRIANLLARQREVELYPAARMFALVNLGLADAYVAVWNAKRFYDRWRPQTAIRAGAADGNPATEPDPSWEPFCVTPPTWEYPSAHAMQSAAAAELLVSTLGTERVAFTDRSTTAPPERPERSFSSLRDAAAEAADSRVLCGIHFRFATDAGLDLGRTLARSILERHLRPHRKAR